MTAKKKQTFEEGIEQLESLIQRLEDEPLALEEAMAAYEQGIKLHKQLMEQLSQTEQKMKTLTPSGQGTKEEAE